MNVQPIKNIVGMMLIVYQSVLLAQGAAEQHARLFQSIMQQEQSKELAPSTRRHKGQRRSIPIDYDNKDLTSIVHELASLKQVNVIMPVKAEDVIKTKVTMHLQHKLTLDEAWNLLISLLDFAGYTLINQGDMYEIVKNNQNISREPLPLYVGTSPDALPASDQRIRYILYLSNLKILPTANVDKEKNELYAILKALLPTDHRIKDANTFYLDPITNSIIITDTMSSVSAAVKVILYLDQVEIQEKMDYVKLRYLDAQFVAKMFMEQIVPDIVPAGFRPNVSSDASFFSRNVKVMADGNNALIVLGKAQGVDRVREFIYKYLDVPLDSGKSVLHVHQLQYLDAPTAANTLNKVIASQKPQSTGQATADKVEGVERFFGEVIIYPDSPAHQSQGSTGQYAGGNKLVVAARDDDWRRLLLLIEEIDIPQPQVIIEVLIAELTDRESKRIAAALRNPDCFPMPPTANIQSAQIPNVGIITDAIKDVDPTTIKADLLRLDDAGKQNFITPNAVPGTSILSISDKNGKTWGVAEILDTLDMDNVVANPHVIATNNKETLVEIKQSRLLPDQPTNTAGAGATTIKRVWVDAPVKVKVTPRISGNIVNLQLDIDIARFADSAATSQATNASTQGRNSRQIVTNANIENGNILVLGGLSRLDETNSSGRTPLLSRIPVLGYLFKNRIKGDESTNLTVFICPTIVQPRLRSGISDYTTDYVNLAKANAIRGGLFDSLNDPITRWFFGATTGETIEKVDDFISQDALQKKEAVAFANVTNTGRRELLPENTQIVKSNSPNQVAGYEDLDVSAPASAAINAPRVAPIVGENGVIPQFPITVALATTPENNMIFPDIQEEHLKALYANLENPLINDEQLSV